MSQIIKTDSSHVDFKNLVASLDAELAEMDGSEHAFYDQFNKIDSLDHVIVVYKNNMAVGCGALKKFDETIMEIKRMYTKVEYRGQGVASSVLLALEKWAEEMSMKKCVLETGQKQPQAISLYLKNGYKKIPNYGPYVGIENSSCFEKDLTVLKE